MSPRAPSAAGACAESHGRFGPETPWRLADGLTNSRSQKAIRRRKLALLRSGLVQPRIRSRLRATNPHMSGLIEVRAKFFKSAGFESTYGNRYPGGAENVNSSSRVAGVWIKDCDHDTLNAAGRK